MSKNHNLIVSLTSFLLQVVNRITNIKNSQNSHETRVSNIYFHGENRKTSKEDILGEKSVIIKQKDKFFISFSIIILFSDSSWVVKNLSRTGLNKSAHLGTQTRIPP